MCGHWRNVSPAPFTPGTQFLSLGVEMVASNFQSCDLVYHRHKVLCEVSGLGLSLIPSSWQAAESGAYSCLGLQVRPLDGEDLPGFLRPCVPFLGPPWPFLPKRCSSLCLGILGTATHSVGAGCMHEWVLSHAVWASVSLTAVQRQQEPEMGQ